MQHPFIVPLKRHWLVILLIAAGVKVLVQYITVLPLDLGIPIHDDAPMYYAAGRGLLAGLPMYEELFESKPPGVFLLAAVSIVLSGGPAFANVLQVLALLALPIVIVIGLWRNRTADVPGGRTGFLAAAVILGVLCGMFVEYSSGRPFASETFGGLFAVLYVVTLAWNRTVEHLSPARIGLCGLWFFLAILFKEPFGLAMFASALLLAPDRRFFIRGFVLPAVIGVAGLALVLALLGALDAYVSIYLPEMFTHRLASRLPFWYRASLLGNVFSYFPDTPVRLLGAVFLFLLASIPLVRHPSAPLRAASAAAWCIAGAVALTALYQQMNHRIAVHDLHIPWSDPMFLLFGSGSLLAGLSLLTAAYGLRGYRPLLRTCVIVLCALGALAVSLAMGGYMTHQHVQSLPVLLAAGIVLLGAQSSPRVRVLQTWFAIAIALAAFAVPLRYTADAEAWHAEIRRKTATADHEAAQLDAVMDACGYERYIAFNTRYFWGRTRHLPLTVYYEQGRSYGDTIMPHMRERFFRHLDEVPILVALDASEFRQKNDIELQAFVLGRFTDTPPPCAAGYAVDGWSLFFRWSPAP